MLDRYLKMILNSRVYDVALETPLVIAGRLSERLGNTVWFKREDLQPVHSFITFETVERVWAEVVVPRLPAFATMQEKWDSANDLPPGSPWAANRPVPNNWR